jgi:hypothetical protein
MDILKMVEKKAKVAEDAVVANSWMQMSGLIMHIQKMTNKLVGKRWNKGQSAVVVRYLVNCFVNFAYHYYDAFCKSLLDESESELDKRAYRYHQAIEKLCNDWEALFPLLYAARMAKDSYFRILQALVGSAEPSMHYWKQMWQQWEWNGVEDSELTAWNAWKADQWGDQPWKQGTITIPHYGRHFELVNFRYAPGVFVVGVPLYNLESPWDWHVVWHEMGGRVVHQLEKEERTEQILKEIPKEAWDAWRDKYAAPQDGDNDGEGASASDSPAEAELSWDNIQKPGWVAEFLEDAYSIISLGPVMVTTLRRVLRQHYEEDHTLQDDRHPPPCLRFDMAGAVLLEMGFQKEKLQELELDPQNCSALGPVAEILYRTMTGDSESRYVRQAFNPDDAGAAEGLKDELLTKEAKDITDAPTSTLIAAACLAFEKDPQAGPQIARTVREMIVRSTPRDEITLDDIEIAPERQFVRLVEGKTWRQLLGESFHDEDPAIYYKHHHSGQFKRWLRGFWLHGQWHQLWHGTREQSHRY